MRSENVATCDAVVSTGRFAEYEVQLRRIESGVSCIVDTEKAIAQATIAHAKIAFDAGDIAAAKAIVLRGHVELFGSHLFKD